MSTPKAQIVLDAVTSGKPVPDDITNVLVIIETDDEGVVVGSMRPITPAHEIRLIESAAEIVGTNEPVYRRYNINPSATFDS